MTARKCAVTDCRKYARPNGWFCSDACRARTWKRNHPEYQSPPSPKQRQDALERRRKASGLQVSFWKACRVLAGPPCFVAEPERVLREALSEKQRARLEGRG